MSRITSLALAMLVGAGMAGQAQAQTALSVTRSATAAQFTTTQSQIRNGPGTSTFVGTSSVTGPTLVPISRFDTSTGILVGARISVNIPYTLSLSALGTVPSSGSNRRVDVSSTLTGSVSIAGASVTTASLAGSPKCIAGDCGNLSKNNTDAASGTLTGNATVGSANLAALAGSGPGTVNFSAQVNATNTQVINAADVTQGNAYTQFQLDGATAASNQYNITYDYLNFSRPSFTTPSQTTTASVNFGTVFRNSGTRTQAFNVSNLVNTANGGVAANTSATSLTGVTRATNDATLSTTLTSLSNLGGGAASGSYNIAFNPTAAGARSDSFTFTMTDTPLVGGVAATGAVGMRSTNLTYSVNANVVDRASPSFSTSAVQTTTSANFGNVYRDAGVQTSAALTLANTGGSFAVAANLDSVTTSGGFTTTLSNGLQVAAGAPQSFTTAFNPGTGASGVRNGTVLLSLSDVTTGMASGTTANSYSLTVNTSATVWDHSNAQFAANPTGRTQTINLGTVFAGSTASANFALTNVADAGTNRVGAGLNSVNTAAAGNFSTNLVPISNIAAGGTTGNYTASLLSNTVGQNNGSFVLNMADVAPGGGITGTGSAYQLTLNATANVINHANPSFSGSLVETSKTLDFGSVSSRGGPVLLNFQLFNIGDANSAGLELYQINGPGNSLFTSNVSSFLNLAGGASSNYSVTLNPLNLGVANGIYSFLFRDYAPGVSGGRNYTLTLNLLASVYDPVPEPATWVSMLIGFGLIGAMARRRTASLPG